MADALSSLLAVLLLAVPFGLAAVASRRDSTLVRRNGHNEWCRCATCVAAPHSR